MTTHISGLLILGPIKLHFVSVSVVSLCFKVVFNTFVIGFMAQVGWTQVEV